MISQDLDNFVQLMRLCGVQIDVAVHDRSPALPGSTDGIHKCGGRRCAVRGNDQPRCSREVPDLVVPALNGATRNGMLRAEVGDGACPGRLGGRRGGSPGRIAVAVGEVESLVSAAEYLGVAAG
ncbi:MAG: hypothetical protein V9E98_05290 [Candidatus Nanopelagicales bacterium]